MKKILTFIKFCISSFGSFLLDIGVFTLASTLLLNVIPDDAIFSHIVVATVIARVCSGIFNFTINRLIFNGKSKGTAGIRYLFVWLVQMLLSANIVDIVAGLLPRIHETLIKMVIDSCLFVISFFVQKKWVFANKKTRESDMEE